MVRKAVISMPLTYLRPHFSCKNLLKSESTSPKILIDPEGKRETFYLKID